MHVTATFDAPCPPAALFDALADLSDYPKWLSIVDRAEPVAAAVPAPAHVDTTTPAPPTGGPAWLVDLRGRLGPLARSKRLRMVRTVHEAPHRLRFERDELDGRSHAPWVLVAEVTATEQGSHLTMHLDYEGAFAGTLLERMVTQAIEQSRPKLLAMVTGTAPAEG